MEFYPKVVLERYCRQLACKGKQNKTENKPHTLPFRHFLNIIMNEVINTNYRVQRITYVRLRNTIIW